MNNAHTAAILTWVYAAGFGLSTIPVAFFSAMGGCLCSPASLRATAAHGLRGFTH